MDSAGNAVKARLLEIATVREGEVEIEGEKVYIREVGALEFSEYGNLLKTDRIKATASLLAACVLDGPGGNPMFETWEDAKPVAKSARVAMPIITKIMVLSGFENKEDKEDVEKESDAS